jgi:hypothetical protein
MKTPIHKVIADVLRASSQPMTPKDIYEAIAARGLYHFRAQDPLHVVASQLRRHCKELHFPSSREVKYFTMTPDGRFSLLDRPERVPPSLYKVSSTSGGKESTTLVTIPTEEQDAAQEGPASADSPSHSEIQWRLLDLGSQMGFSVWAPMGDRGKCWDSKRLGDVPKLLQKLPVRFVAPVAK